MSSQIKRDSCSPAGELVKLAKEHTSSVSILKEGKKADVKKAFWSDGAWRKTRHENHSSGGRR